MSKLAVRIRQKVSLGVVLVLCAFPVASWAQKHTTSLNIDRNLSFNSTSKQSANPSLNSSVRRRPADDCFNNYSAQDKQLIQELLEKIEDLRKNLPTDQFVSQVERLTQKTLEQLSPLGRQALGATLAMTQVRALTNTLESDAEFAKLFLEWSQAYDNYFDVATRIRGRTFLRESSTKQIQDTMNKEAVALNKLRNHLIKRSQNIPELRTQTPLILQQIYQASNQLNAFASNQIEGAINNLQVLSAGLKATRDVSIAFVAVGGAYLSLGIASAPAAAASASAAASIGALVGKAALVGATSGAAYMVTRETVVNFSETFLNSQQLGTSFWCEAGKAYADSDGLKKAMVGAAVGGVLGPMLSFAPAKALVVVGAAGSTLSANNARHNIQQAWQETRDLGQQRKQGIPINPDLARSRNAHVVESTVALGETAVGVVATKKVISSIVSKPNTASSVAVQASGDFSRNNDAVENINHLVTHEATRNSNLFKTYLDIILRGNDNTTGADVVEHNLFR